jgi:hypothetical protein
VLAVYTRPRDGDCPLVCLDETSKQLIAETRMPISMKAGRPARFDYEYERNGTTNLFTMFAPLEGCRHVKVTDRHTAVDYARVLKDLADIHFAHAKTRYRYRCRTWRLSLTSGPCRWRLRSPACGWNCKALGKHCGHSWYLPRKTSLKSARAGWISLKRLWSIW